MSINATPKMNRLLLRHIAATTEEKQEREYAKSADEQVEDTKRRTRNALARIMIPRMGLSSIRKGAAVAERIISNPIRMSDDAITDANQEDEVSAAFARIFKKFSNHTRRNQKGVLQLSLPPTGQLSLQDQQDISTLRRAGVISDA